MGYSTQQIRNIALVGHAGAGKTSLAEALLQEAGVLHQKGFVEKHTTLSDYHDEEKASGHSVYTSFVHALYKGTMINLADTPGAADFIAQALQAVPLVDMVAVVINASAGIEQATRRWMERAREENVCRMIIINKIDTGGSDLRALVEEIQSEFGKECLPINLPKAGGTEVVDCFFGERGDTDLWPVAEAHTRIVEQVVEVDENLMADYLEKGSVNPEALHDAFEGALREGHVIPICFVSARPSAAPESSIGVKELLEMFVNLAPNPIEGNHRSFYFGRKPEETFAGSLEPQSHVLVHVGAVIHDPFLGKISVFRVHQGLLKANSQLFVSDRESGEGKKPVKVGHLFKLQGKEHIELGEVVPGDIAAYAKVEESRRDCVLHDHHDEDDIHLLPVSYPEPMFGLALTVKTKNDEQRFSEVLHKITDQDPGLRLVRDPVTKETVLYGMGELHLRTVFEGVKSRYKIDLDKAPPRISYRETVTIAAEGHCRHKKQTGGAGQFAEVFLRIKPLGRGEGFRFVDDVVGGAIPNQFIPAVEKGVRAAYAAGALAGYLMQDIEVSVHDGKHHPVDSKEIAFITAGKKAFLDAFHKARPVLLEPVMKVAVTAPQNSIGDLTGNITGKRGRILDTEMSGRDAAVLSAHVPLAELSSFQNELKSFTAGRGSYSMEFAHYDIVPDAVQKTLVAQYRPTEAEEE